MGLISDYSEQAAEKFGQFKDQLKYGFLSRIPVSPPDNLPALYECPLCGEMILSDDQNNHMHEKHGNQYAYLRVNNRIINDYIFLEGPIKSIDAVVLGNQTARLIIQVNDQPPKERDVSGTVSLVNYLKDVSAGEVNIFINISSVRKEYILYCEHLPSFSNNLIDQAALRYLFIPLSNGEKPDYSNFTNKFINAAKNRLENRYASGLHDYALAFHLVQEKQEAKEHFESALSCLKNFKTNFAIWARRILALRMNSFSLLSDCSIKSRFYTANCFFNKQESRFKIKDKIATVQQNDFDYGVYIDAFSERFLDSLIAFYNDDFDILEVLCHTLHGMVSDKERNNQDKLFLLCARTAVKKEDKVKKEMYYQQLLGHPQFGNEAEEMMK